MACSCCPSAQPDSHGGSALHFYAVATSPKVSMMALSMMGVVQLLQSKVDPSRKPESSEDTAMRGNPRQDAASCEWSGRGHLDEMVELNAGTPKGRLLRYQRLVNKLQKATQIT